MLDTSNQRSVIEGNKIKNVLSRFHWPIL